MIYTHTEKMVILNILLNNGPQTFLGLIEISLLKIDAQGLNEMIEDGFIIKSGNVYTGLEF